MPRLVMFQPDIALNLGASIRVAACFGASVDVIEPCGFPFSIRALRRSGLDYLEHVAVRRWTSWEKYAAAGEVGRLILLTTSADAPPIWRCAFREDDRIMLGRESAGAPAEVHAAADLRLRIPLEARARSLNVSVAAAVALAEARRQFAASPPESAPEARAASEG
ncbi:MAG: TrmH family RNA methyltransferase [Pseudomonadota bacterium]